MKSTILKKTVAQFLLIVSGCLLFSSIIFADGEAPWGSSPTVLLNGGFESFATLTSDGNYIIAMNDGAIKLQKVDPNGNALWGGGTPVTIPSSTGGTAEIVADAAGGALIHHTGPTSSNRNNYLSRVNSSGTILWTSGPFDTSLVTDFWPRVIHDGNNGAYFSWWRNDRTTLIVHIGSDGDVCDVATCGVDWNSGGGGTYRPLALPTSPTSPTRPEPRMVLSDGGSVIITYTGTGGNLHTVKLNPDGSNDWGAAGTYVEIADNGSNFMVEPDGSNGVFIAYPTFDATDWLIKVARIDVNGNIVLGNASEGVTVKNIDNTLRSVDYLVSSSDNAGNLFLGWSEQVIATSEYVPYTQKYNTSGTEQWTTGGVQLATDGDSMDDFFEVTYLYNLPHTLVSDGTGGVIAALNRYGGAIQSAVVGQKVTSAGNLDWGTDGFFLTEDLANDYDYTQDVVSNGSGGAFFDWYQYDDSTGLDGIAIQYVQTLSGGGGGNNGEITGTAVVDCDTGSPSVNSSLDPGDFNFYTNVGTTSNPTSIGTTQDIYSDIGGSTLGVTDGTRFISINDPRDVRGASDCNNNGFQLTVGVQESDADQTFFEDSTDTYSIPANTIRAVTSNDACPAGYTANSNGLCYEDTAICNDNDGLCNDGAEAAAADYNYDGTAFETASTFSSGAQPVTGPVGSEVSNDDVIMDTATNAGAEYFGNAGIAVAFYAQVPASQTPGTYSIVLVYSIT